MSQLWRDYFTAVSTYGASECGKAKTFLPMLSLYQVTGLAA